MLIYKNLAFSNWASKYHISDDALASAVNEMEQGAYEANLGGSVFKKRISIGNKGKRGGARTVVAFVVNERAFFIRFPAILASKTLRSVTLSCGSFRTSCPAMGPVKAFEKSSVGPTLISSLTLKPSDSMSLII